VIFGVLKVFYQFYSITALLWKIRGANYILIQNPPSIPVLLIAVIYKFITKTKLIIDWHNLNYTILEIKLGPSHPFVKICKLYESLFSRYANINLTVTKAMKEFLTNEFKLNSDKIIVLYDKAAHQFEPLDREAKLKVIGDHPELYSGFNPETDKLIVSSTSFTPDEDFNILVQALKLYDVNSNVPQLKVIITGKGPLKQEFLNEVKQANFSKVKVDCAWLTAEDYPKILATADLGVSLHTSSSGIDLPMKVVDMFGCGLPVIALDFLALPELVDESNGKRVNSSKEIYEGLVELLTDGKAYAALKSHAIIKSQERWESNWKSTFGDKLV
jgi:beta-1,4-mannosyltransferase